MTRRCARRGRGWIDTPAVPTTGGPRAWQIYLTSSQLRTRLDELRPLVGEYEPLQAAEAALADGSSTGTALAGLSAVRPRRDETVTAG